MRRKNNNSSRTIVSSKYLNVEQIDNICNILTDRYIEELPDNDTLLRQIDIEDFAKKMLGCTIVYESIAEDADCLGCLSDGIVPIPVIRNAQPVNVVFPKNTIVIDQYLNVPSQFNRRRFTIAHEAGHVIKNRMYGNSGAEYNHVGGITLDSATGLRKRYSFKELEANNFAESLLIPEGMIAMLMHKLYEDRKIVEYPGKILNDEDRKNVQSMAKIFGVAYITMLIRLEHLGYTTYGELGPYVEDVVLGENKDE